MSFIQQEVFFTKKQATTSSIKRELPPSLSYSLIEPSTLSTFQRILLTTDGTITHMLEAYFREVVQVVKLSEELVLLNTEVPYADLKKGTEIIDRKILLKGKTSCKNFIYAESVIVPERLNETVRDKLLRTNNPIGKIWFDCKTETFKEIFNFGKEPAKDLAIYFDIQSDSNLLFRTYGVFSNQHLIMLITEKFPESHFNLLA